MTDEPRTEAGTPEQTHSPEYNRGWADGNAAALDACNPIIERLQAAAGPRDLHCARCDARIELRHYDYPQHVRDHVPVAEATALAKASDQDWPRTEAGPIPDGPYRVEWPSEQGGWFTIWGSGGWAIPIVALGVQSAMEHIATLLNREAEAAAGLRDDNLLRNYLEKLAAGPREGSLADALDAHRFSEVVDMNEHCGRSCADLIAAAAGRETFVGPGGKRIKVKFAEAAAGPRDEWDHAPADLSTHCEGCIRQGEDAAGPRSATLTESLSRSIETAYQRGRAEAAAGPRDEGLDVERLARAMQNVEDELTATNIAYEYAALAKASEPLERIESENRS